MSAILDLISSGVPPLLDSLTGYLTPDNQAADGPAPDLPVGLSNEWGIYLDGEKVLTPDSFLALDYKRDATIADYPIEGGGFETYNKVQRPFDVRLRLTKGGGPGDRRDFLAAVESIFESLSLYDVVTPEKTYLSCNVTSIGHGRSAMNGMGLLTIDIALREVRVTARTAFANVQSPPAAGIVYGGTVQPQPTPAPVQAIVTKALQRPTESTVFSDTVGPL